MEENKLIESKKILTDYMLELNNDIQRAEDWVNTGADEEMYFAIKTVIDELERLQKENALNFEKTVHTCLHCSENTPLYCEKCYQELISKNAELQLENEKIKTRIHYKIEKCERKLKNNISGLKRLLLETKMGTLKDGMVISVN